MPLFYQQDINDTTRLGIWLIEEEEDFFMKSVQSHRDVTHPHKRLQHLAGRFLLKFLYPDFPFHLIQIADTRKPFLIDETYHFSISHCGDYAAVIVSSDHRVGIDIEIPSEKIAKVKSKFISQEETMLIAPQTLEELTLIWSSKEAIYKWHGEGKIDFRQHIQLKSYARERKRFACHFAKTGSALDIELNSFNGLCLSYVFTKA